MTKNNFLGIDYGAKKAGTTAVCFEENDQLRVLQTKKNQDADAFLFKLIDSHLPNQIFIDAPLSLPAAYSGKGTDFFYRKCDRETSAMSPMFLGGLTARAMKLHDEHKETVAFFEAYPKGICRMLLPETSTYKKPKLLQIFLEELKPHLPYPLASKPASWHQVDSVLAWLVGYRYNEGIAVCYGDKEEGIIWI